MKDKTIVVYDFETNGLWSPLNQPIQVALLVIENMKIVDRYDSYISCDRQLPPNIQFLTGITDEILKDKGQPMEKVFKALRGFFGRENVILSGYNILRFDNHFLNYYMQLHEMDFRVEMEMCWDVYGHIKGNVNCREKSKKDSWGKHHSRCISGKSKFLLSLEDACRYYDVEYDEEKAHNAMYDVEKTWEMMKIQLEELKTPQKGLFDSRAERLRPNPDYYGEDITPKEQGTIKAVRKKLEYLEWKRKYNV